MQVIMFWQVHYLAHRPGFPENSHDSGWQPIQGALQTFLGTLLSHTAGNISYIHAVLKAILRTKDGLDSSSCRIHHISFVAMGLLQNQRGATPPVYGHKIQLPCSYYDPLLTGSTVQSQHFEMPHGLFKLPVSPAVKRLSPSKKASPSKRRRGPQSDAHKKAEPGLDAQFGTPSGETLTASKQKTRKPVAGHKKRRQSTPYATDEQRRQAEKQLSDLASSDHEDSDLDSVLCEKCQCGNRAEFMLLCDHCNKG